MGNPKTFNGFYRGEVVNDQDPYDAGRVRIRVFGVYDNVMDQHLPWAIMADPFMGGQGDLGGFFVPDVGSHVWVFFEHGDHMQPVYFAGAPARPHGPSERTTGEYPRNKVFKTRGGHVIEIDDSPGGARVHIKHASGTHKEYQDDGSSLEEVKQDMTVYVEGDSTVYVKGNVDETVEGNVTRTVKGNVTETIEGDFSTSIVGTRTEQSGESSEYASGGDMTVSGSRVDVN